MSDDERWTPPVGPVDPEHPECAAVIAEVWTLLDGECTRGDARQAQAPPRRMPGVPAALRRRGAGQDADRQEVQRREGARSGFASGCASRSAAPRSSAAASAPTFEPALGRLPWLAFECLRSRFLRPRLAMVLLRVVRGLSQPASGGRV